MEASTSSSLIKRNHANNVVNIINENYTLRVVVSLFISMLLYSLLLVLLNLHFITLRNLLTATLSEV